MTDSLADLSGFPYVSARLGMEGTGEQVGATWCDSRIRLDRVWNSGRPSNIVQEVIPRFHIHSQKTVSHR